MKIHERGADVRHHEAIFPLQEHERFRGGLSPDRVPPLVECRDVRSLNLSSS